MDNRIIVQAEALTKTIPGPEGILTLLDNISFSIKATEALAIVGESGSGKSTLLCLLAGLDTPSSGRVFLNGIGLNDLDEDGRAAVRRKRVGFVFQSFQLLGNMTAVENVMLPLELAGDLHPENLAREVLARVGLDSRRNHYPNQLSGGEQQRVAIARAFSICPQILFADEPTGNLDRATGDSVNQLLFSLVDEFGTTLVVVTHDESLAQRCERRLKLEQGKLVP